MRIIKNWFLVFLSFGALEHKISLYKNTISDLVPTGANR